MRVRAADISGTVTAVRMAFLATLGETELRLRFYASPVIFFFSCKLQLQEYLKHSCFFRIWLTALHESNWDPDKQMEWHGCLSLPKNRAKRVLLRRQVEQHFGECGLRMLWQLFQLKISPKFLHVWMCAAHTDTSEIFLNVWIILGPVYLVTFLIYF